MKQTIKELLDRLPFDGYKTWIGFIGGAIVLAAMQLHRLDPGTGGYALDVLTLWTGVALSHKELKTPSEPEIGSLPPQP